MGYDPTIGDPARVATRAGSPIVGS